MRSVSALLLIILSAALVGACGGTAPSDEDNGSSGEAGSREAPKLLITPGSPRARAGETGQRVRPPSELEITIDSCTWQAVETGGPVVLNVTFSIQNNAPESLYATYRVQNQARTTFFRPKGFEQSITIYTKESDSRTLNTDKFEVGSDDLELVIAGQRRTTDIVPLDNCTQP